MLAVVEHEEHVAVGEVEPERIGGARAARGLDPERTRRLGRHVRRACRGGEVDEPHAVGAAADVTMRQSERDAGLADPAGPGQRHEARPPQRLADRVQLARAAYKRRQRKRKVVLALGRIDPVNAGWCLFRGRRRRPDPEPGLGVEEVEPRDVDLELEWLALARIGRPLEAGDEGDALAAGTPGGDSRLLVLGVLDDERLDDLRVVTASACTLKCT